MSESQRVIELRREIREMEANKASLDPALYDVMHQALLDDLAELGATLEEPTPRPRPVPRVVTTATPRRSGPGPIEQAYLAAPAAPETPVPSTPEPTKTKRPYHRKKPLPPKGERSRARRDPAAGANESRPVLSERLGSTLEPAPAAAHQAAAISIVGDVRYRLRGVRRQVWMLLADLESLTAPQLKEVASELEVLAGATHQAHQLSLGREVVG